jgi:hypothetical protein
MTGGGQGGVREGGMAGEAEIVVGTKRKDGAAVEGGVDSATAGKRRAGSKAVLGLQGGELGAKAG